MRRPVTLPVLPAVALLLAVALLAGCAGGATDAAPPGSPAHSASVPAESSPSTSAAPSAPLSFVPTLATVSRPAWHLPYAAARQAAVALGSGRVLLAGGLLAGDASTDRVLRVDPRQSEVTPMPSLPVAVHDVAGGLAGTTPLVVGGGNATEQDVVQALRSGRWQVVGHLPGARSDLNVVQHGALPLVVGGYDGTGTPRAVLAVSADGTERTVGELVRGVRYAATAVLGHTAYVLGGEVLGRELDTVQALDLRTGRARVLGPLPAPLGHAMAATVGSRILLMGGRTAPDRQTAAMWWYDPAGGRFTRAGLLPHPLSDAAVSSSGRTVWLYGGEDPSVTSGVLTVSVR